MGRRDGLPKGLDVGEVSIVTLTRDADGLEELGAQSTEGDCIALYTV